MRDLTEEELKLAPDWAVKFDFFGGRLIFMSDVVDVASQSFRFIDIQSGDYWVGSDGEYDLCTRLIIKKPFDITKHEVSNHVTVLENGELGVFDSGWVISKDRAIAIAKALRANGEDLK